MKDDAQDDVKDGFFEFIWPILLWAAFVSIVLISLVLVLNEWDGNSYGEAQCKEYVGAEYVFDSPRCFRMVNGKLQYVDFDREEAIRQYEQRKTR